MSTTVWSNELEMKFLECFHEESLLWDQKHAMYKDKKRSHNAWTRLSSFMGIPIPDLKRKRDSLLSSYRKYRKLIKNSKESGADESEVYKPVWFAYDFIDSFLGNGQSYMIKKKKDKVEDDTEDDDQPVLTKSKTSSVKQTKSRRKNPPELEQAGTYIKEAITTLNTALVGKDSHTENCDLYGKMLANKLRKLSEIDQAEIMYEIDGIFLRRLSNPPLSHYCPSTSPTPSLYTTVKRPLSSESSYSKHIPETEYQDNPASNEASEDQSETITLKKKK